MEGEIYKEEIIKFNLHKNLYPFDPSPKSLESIFEQLVDLEKIYLIGTKVRV